MYLLPTIYYTIEMNSMIVGLHYDFISPKQNYVEKIFILLQKSQLLIRLYKN